MSQLCQTLADLANFFNMLVVFLLAVYAIIKYYNRNFLIDVPTNTLATLKKDLNFVSIAGFVFIFCSWITVGGANPTNINIRYNEIAGNCRFLGLIWFLDFLIVVGANIFLYLKFKNNAQNNTDLSSILKSIMFLPLIYCAVFLVLGYFIEV